MSATQVLNAPTCYTTLAPNEVLSDPTFAISASPESSQP